jgi:hypothetical protein
MCAQYNTYKKQRWTRPISLSIDIKQLCETLEASPVGNFLLWADDLGVSQVDPTGWACLGYVQVLGAEVGWVRVEVVGVVNLN